MQLYIARRHIIRCHVEVHPFTLKSLFWDEPTMEIYLKRAKEVVMSMKTNKEDCYSRKIDSKFEYLVGVTWKKYSWITTNMVTFYVQVEDHHVSITSIFLS